jgi:hypothetical protein
MRWSMTRSRPPRCNVKRTRLYRMTKALIVNSCTQCTGQFGYQCYSKCRLYPLKEIIQYEHKEVKT